MLKCSNAPMLQSSNPQALRCSNALMLQCTNSQVLKCIDAPLQCTNAQMHKCSTAQIPNCTSPMQSKANQTKATQTKRSVCRQRTRLSLSWLRKLPQANTMARMLRKCLEFRISRIPAAMIFADLATTTRDDCKLFLSSMQSSRMRRRGIFSISSMKSSTYFGVGKGNIKAAVR